MDAVLLSRIQFAVTIGFHFLFPPITIGLAWLLVIAEFKGWRKDDETFVQMGKFFAKLLGLTFVVGVATGIVMEFKLPVTILLRDFLETDARPRRPVFEAS